MNELSEALDLCVHSEIQKLTKDRERQEDVANRIYDWLVNKAVKKPIPNLDAKLEEWRLRIKHLSENVEVKYSNGKFVVICAGSADDTLKRLRLGSDWFVGTPYVLELIVFGLFKNDSVSI